MMSGNVLDGLCLLSTTANTSLTSTGTVASGWCSAVDMIEIAGIVTRNSGTGVCVVTLEGATDSSGTGATTITGIDANLPTAVGNAVFTIPAVKLAAAGYTHVRAVVTWTSGTLSTSIRILGVSKVRPASAYDTTNVTRYIL